MTPKLREIRTTRRAASVTRRQVAAAVKAVMSERPRGFTFVEFESDEDAAKAIRNLTERAPETERLLRGVNRRKRVAGAASK